MKFEWECYFVRAIFCCATLQELLMHSCALSGTKSLAHVRQTEVGVSRDKQHCTGVQSAAALTTR
jgi:hypothetical protein